MKANIQITQVEFKVDTLEWSVRFSTPSGNDLLIPVTAGSPPFKNTRHEINRI